MRDEFLLFINYIGLYPTVIFTGFVIFAALYWLVSLFGMADMDTFDIGADIGGDISGDIGADIGDVSATGFFTGVMLKFGLYGVPLIYIVTFVSIIGWVLSYIYTSYLHIMLNSGILYYVFGTGALLLVIVVSMWLTGIIIAPIRKNVEKMPKRNAANNIGKVATIRSLTVTETHGEAELHDGGAGLILRIRSNIDNTDKALNQGDKVVLVTYLKDLNIYEVAPLKDEG